MNKEKLNKNKKIIKKLAYPMLVISFFLFILISIIYKLNHQTFYFFNNRGDVVLTESMSSVHPDNHDLDGTSRIYRNDFVISTRIDQNTELNVHDVVLFDNPLIGVDMHRIIAIKYEGQKAEFVGMHLKEMEGETVFYPTDPTFKVKFRDALSFSKVEALIYSIGSPLDPNEYYFNTNIVGVNVDIESTLLENNVYKNIVTYDKGSALYTPFSITRRSYSYNSYFSYVKLSGGYHNITVESSVMDGSEEQTYLYNAIPKYQIRGDASNTPDGWFGRESLYSKVHTVMPKVGVIFKYIISPYGITMIVGLMLIPFIYSLLTKKTKEKKERS